MPKKKESESEEESSESDSSSSEVETTAKVSSKNTAKSNGKPVKVMAVFYTWNCFLY